MAYQAIGLGSSANDGTGDTLRIGGDKVNDNFVEIYTALGAGSTTALKIITTGASSGDALIFNSSNSRFEPTAVQATSFTTLTAEGSTDDSFETVIGVVDPTADRTINFPNATGTVITTGNLSDISFGANLVFEGSTADSFETTLAATDPTADRTITLPNLTGTVSLITATETLTNKTLTTPVIASLLQASGSNTLTMPAATDTLVGKATTDTFTNKTFDLGGTGNSLTGSLAEFNSALQSESFVSLTGSETLTNKTLTSPTLNSPAINSPTIIFEGSTADSFETTIAVVDPTADRTITLPNATDTLVGKATTDTLTNKTLTTPIIAEIDSASTITLDAATDIILDANGADIFLKDDGTTYGSLTNTSGNLIIKSGTTTAATFSGANVTLAGTVGSGAITSSSTVTATQAILSSASPLVFEGATADSFETTIAVTDPTADRTITLPDGTGTVALTSDITALAGIDDQSSSNDDQITITDTAVVINEDSDDVDFRVESNGKTHAIFVDAGNDKVGINITAGVPDAVLHIQSDGAGQAPNAAADELCLEGSANVGMSILSGNTSAGRIYFGDNGDDDIGQIRYNHDDNSMNFKVNALADSLKIDSAGHVTTPLNPAFRVAQSTSGDFANGHTAFNGTGGITEQYDVNSDLAGNGTFTAPVTGTYLFTIGIADANSTDDTSYDMRLLTSNRNYRWGIRNKFEDNTTGITTMTIKGSVIADMDANDTASVEVATSATITIEGNVEHSFFSGVLIG